MDKRFFSQFRHKSLLRERDRWELFFSYLFSFSLLTLSMGIQKLAIETNRMQSYVQVIADSQLGIALAFSLIVAHFQYHLCHKTRIEVLCRLLAGDTLRAIRVRYMLESLLILGGACLAVILLNLSMGFPNTDVFYLAMTFVAYTLVSVFLVKSEGI